MPTFLAVIGKSRFSMIYSNNCITKFAYILTRCPSLSIVGVSDRRGEKWQTVLSMDMHVGNAIPVFAYTQGATVNLT